MKSVELSNWNELKKQFGLNDDDNQLLSAPQISKELKHFVLKQKNEPNIVPINCSKKFDSICIFILKTIQQDKHVTRLIYEYQGTAN